jgi:hypothetical protein
MKLITLNLLLLVFLFVSVDASSNTRKRKSFSNRNRDYKGYIGISEGPSFSLGSYPADATIGVSSYFSFGYRFGKNWGLAINSFSTIQGIKNETETSDLLYLGLLVGPQYTLKPSKKLYIDIKPCIGYMVTDSLKIRLVNEVSDGPFTSVVYDLGTSLRYNFSKRWYFSSSIDYLYSTPKFSSGTEIVSSLKIGIGIGYLLK